jgi:predicted DCC family thiol-disulfide oxidoreductase YuxK
MVRGLEGAPPLRVVGGRSEGMNASSVDPAKIGESTLADRPAAIVYDGECPFCSRYVRLVRLRESVGPVELINARDGGPVVAEIVRAGIDLDEGMVLKLGNRLYHGDDCIHMLALLGTRLGVFNRLNAAMFRSPRAARFFYPALRAGRNAALRLLGRSRILP